MSSLHFHIIPKIGDQLFHCGERIPLLYAVERKRIDGFFTFRAAVAGQPG
jgi:hypothetical protein